MVFGHNSKDDITEEYIRVSKEIRAKFFGYVEVIVGQKEAPLRFFMGKIG